jgi:hypothetical protein
MTKAEILKLRREGFSILENGGYLSPVDLDVLDRSDDDVKVGMSRKSELVSRAGLRFTRPMSRRELLRHSK